MSHITPEQRYLIASMLNQGYKQKDIAVAIGKNKSVVSREIGRNCDQRSGKYKEGLAQRKYEGRLESKATSIRFTDAVKTYVIEELAKKKSPDQIRGAALLEGKPCVSNEWIYQFIWKDKKQGGALYLNLRTEGKTYRKRGNKKDRRGIIPGRVDISERPAIVDKRERMGDLEIDTLIGQNHQGAIVTINDRMTGMLKMVKVDSRDAGQVALKAIRTLRQWKPFLKTITSDNGKEFATHAAISKKLDIDFYFARPYHSWERGSNENLNGLIRQYIPKKTNITLLSEKYIKYVEKELNNRPIKRFKYQTPIDIFNTTINQSKVAFAT